MRKKPKIGLVFGSGAVRGFAHIGVLEVLEEAGIKPDMISGTSAGAMIGAFYASGITPQQMRKLAMKSKIIDLLDFTQLKTGIIAGAKIEAFLRKEMGSKKFSQLNMPLYIVATELLKAEKTVFSEGDVTDAVMASIAIPGVFQPQPIGKHRYIDGGYVDPIPADILHQKGADIIIVVDISLDLKKTDVFVFKKTEFTDKMREQFIISEQTAMHDFVKSLFFKMPKLLERIVDLLVSIILSPKRVFDVLTKSEPPEMIYTFIRSIEILNNQLSKEEVAKDYVDVVIHPTYHGVKFAEFDKADYCIERGKIAAKKALPKIRKVIANYERKAKRARQSR